MVKTLLSYVLSTIEIENYFFAFMLAAIVYLYIKAILQLNYGF